MTEKLFPRGGAGSPQLSHFPPGPRPSKNLLFHAAIRAILQAMRGRAWSKRYLRGPAVAGLAGAVCSLLLAACGGASLQELDRVLRRSWQSYTRHYLSPEGRVVVPERGGDTISEAQAYALLRAVWAGDADTFGRVYAWTYAHLSRRQSHGDHLLAWRWGKGEDGAEKILDANTASDGNLDYALALLLAARRGWRPPPGLPGYAAEGARMQRDMLAKEVVTLPSGETLLAPGNWLEAAPPHLLNPSYFFPSAYRLFQRSSGEAGWGKLLASVYPALTRLSQGVGGAPGVGLFPDWVLVDAQGRFDPAPEWEGDYGWEAVRLPWRVALDRIWFGEKRAATLLQERFYPFMKQEWQTRGKILALYRLDGQPLADYESPVLYAGVLAAALALEDKDFARQMAEKILSFYHESGERAYFAAPDNYYADNWAWLGLALYHGWVRP